MVLPRLVGQDRQHRADISSRETVISCRTFAEYVGGAAVVARRQALGRAGSAAHERGALVDSGQNERWILFELDLADDGTQDRWRRPRIADRGGSGAALAISSACA